MRIALIHALKHSIVPIEASFAKLWPDARLMNLLDDSLSADLARDGRLTDAMTERFLALGRYAVSTGSDAILFTCSAFGPCIEAVARAHAPMPVLKPNEAMIEQAAAQGRKNRLALDFRADVGVDAAGVSALRRTGAKTGGRRFGRARPRRPCGARSPGGGSVKSACATAT